MLILLYLSTFSQTTHGHATLIFVWDVRIELPSYPTCVADVYPAWTETTLLLLILRLRYISLFLKFVVA
jgi:hypothetical protein